jgi:hypothetical protein
MEEVTQLSPIVVVPKKNGKLHTNARLMKLNVNTKKIPYPLLFTNEVLNMVISYEGYS